MPAEFGIVYPLWDYAADEGRFLERLVGEVSIDQVTVPVISGAWTAFRPVVGGDFPFFHTDGGWHYRPSSRPYGGGAIRPRKARWFSAGDQLAQLCTRLASLGVRLIARIDLRAVRSVIEDQPHVAQRTAWGQETPDSGACICNPDVREALRAVCEDLARYSPAGYELVNWALDHDAGAAAHNFAWDPDLARLLSTCFCAACRQVAGRAEIDVHQVARSVRVSIERRLESPPGTAALEEDAAISAYRAARAADCAAWLRRLVEAEPERRRLLLRDLGSPPLESCAPWTHRVRLGRAPLASRWSAALAAARECGGVSMPAWLPTVAGPDDLVRWVHESVQAGVSLIDFEGVTEAPATCLTWLRQAVRFARRG